MNSQRSLTDQLSELANLVEDHELPEEAAWLREALGEAQEGAEDVPRPADRNLQICIDIANRNGLYDAADWVWSHLHADEEDL